ncbi:MAG: hemerythrin family protein [Rhodocyclaceae bacterium]|nr:hemerythrin family protein [Rhodocyclaceae bacterium]
MKMAAALEQLEREHAAIAAAIERFALQAVQLGAGEELAESLRSLIVEISMHFGFEESLMGEGGYAGFEPHHRQHLAMMIELGLMLDRVEETQAGTQLARNVDFIGQWHREHIEQADRALFEWLAQRAELEKAAVPPAPT